MEEEIVVEVGQQVVIKPSDSVYPKRLARVVKVDVREGKQYLGLHVDQHRADHVVWRYVDQVGVVRE